MSLLGLAGVLEELRVVGFLGERLLLLLVEGLLDLLVGDLDVLLLGLALDPLEGDQQLHHLVAQRVVLLLALGLELGVGRPSAGPWPASASSCASARRTRCSRAASGAAARRPGRRTCDATVSQWSNVGLLDRAAVDGRDGVARHPAAPGDDGCGHKKGAKRQQNRSLFLITRTEGSGCASQALSKRAQAASRLHREQRVRGAHDGREALGGVVGHAHRELRLARLVQRAGDLRAQLLGPHASRARSA